MVTDRKYWDFLQKLWNIGPKLVYVCSKSPTSPKNYGNNYQQNRINNWLVWVILKIRLLLKNRATCEKKSIFVIFAIKGYWGYVSTPQNHGRWPPQNCFPHFLSLLTSILSITTVKFRSPRFGKLSRIFDSIPRTKCVNRFLYAKLSKLISVKVPVFTCRQGIYNT